MQPSLRISHSRLPFSFSYSVNRISVHVLGSKIQRIVVGSLEIADLGLEIVPLHAGGLACLAADAARDTSISFATSASWLRTEGGVRVDADRGCKSCD